MAPRNNNIWSYKNMVPRNILGANDKMHIISSDGKRVYTR